MKIPHDIIALVITGVACLVCVALLLAIAIVPVYN